MSLLEVSEYLALGFEITFKGVRYYVEGGIERVSEDDLELNVSTIYRVEDEQYDLEPSDELLNNIYVAINDSYELISRGDMTAETIH